MTVAFLICSGCVTTPRPAGEGVSSPTAADTRIPDKPVPSGGIANVCANPVPGPATPPPGAVTVNPTVPLDLATKTENYPPGTTFWLAPGTHRLGDGEFSQVSPKDRDVYIGAPGAILDGRGLNRYAYTGYATDVVIRFLTVRGFDSPVDEGVVNHDSGDRWIIEHNIIEDNHGAGLMAGVGQQVRGNCLRNNGQYGMNAFKLAGALGGLVVEGNEIVGNNADDLEIKQPGCGCTGGIKFWAVNGADIRGNWVHDNHGVGLWADTNNNDFLIENNLIENNDAEGVFYEISYNLVMRGNTLRHNAVKTGQTFATRGDNFPVGAVYISESGGEPRVRARTDRLEIAGNYFVDNWGGIVTWENADRFCNSVANSSTGYCTLLEPNVTKCSPPGIATQPLLDDCRWKTQRVDIAYNRFVTGMDTVCGPDDRSDRMAVLSNVGTVPDWSPYRGDVIQKAITYGQDVKWHDNVYVGTWRFTSFAPDKTLDVAQWQSAPSAQDAGSSFMSSSSSGGC